MFDYITTTFGSVTEFVAIITVAITLLSTFLALLEYYRNKAYCDYFFIEDFARPNFRSGLHPEYLSYAILIIAAITILFYLLSPVVLTIKGYFIIYPVLLILVYIVARLISYFMFTEYHKQQKNDMKCYDRVDLKRSATTTSRWKALQWTASSSVVVIALLTWAFTEQIMYMAIGFIAAAYVYMKADYEIRKKRIKIVLRFLISVTYCNKKYAVLSSYNQKFYCVRYSMENDVIDLFLDDVVILDSLSSNNISPSKRIYFKKYIRHLNDNIITD